MKMRAMNEFHLIVMVLAIFSIVSGAGIYFAGDIHLSMISVLGGSLASAGVTGDILKKSNELSEVNIEIEGN